MKTQKVFYKSSKIDGIQIFYRESGEASKPPLVLLGGFPSSSITFGGLIEKLKDHYHVIAPDYPGFGNSETPGSSQFAYTFDNLSKIMEKFLDALGINTFSLYAFDYGGPIGFRIASRNPFRIQSLIIQNANAYMEGIGAGFNELMPFLQNRNEETEKPVRALFSLEGVKVFYFTGAEDITKINPDHYLSDLNFLLEPGRLEVHLDLLHNYSSNVAEYPTWQNYFKTHQPPTLLVWGKNDPFFPESAARAFQKDLKNASLHLFNTSHFALEEYGDEIAEKVLEFLSSTLPNN